MGCKFHIDFDGYPKLWEVFHHLFDLWQQVKFFLVPVELDFVVNEVDAIGIVCVEGTTGLAQACAYDLVDRLLSAVCGQRLEEAVAANLDYEISSQKEDGSWIHRKK